MIFNAGSSAISGSALAGALLTALIIYVLAWRDGISGYRFILIGLGVSQFMLSIVSYVISRAELYEARQAMTWLVGSVGQAGAGELRTLLVALVLICGPSSSATTPRRHSAHGSSSTDWHSSRCRSS